MREGKTHYSPSGGISELKEAVLRKLKDENQLDYKNDEIVITHGAKGAIYNVLRVICDNDDEVIVPAPYYPGYLGMIKLAGAKPTVVQTSKENDFKLTIALLEQVVNKKTRVILLNNPSNPVGSVYTKEELKQLADYIADKQIFVISDEIYEKLLYGSTKYCSFATLGEDIKKLTFTVNGFSKTYAMTGWRIGYVAGPSNVISTIVRLQSQSLSCLSPFIQLACVSALEGDQECVNKMVDEYRSRRDYLCTRIGEMGLDFPKPEGAFYVFPDISNYLGSKYQGKTVNTSFEFASLLLDEEKVALLFGPAFGVEGYLRLTFATPDLKEIEKGMDRLERFLGEFNS